MEINHLNSFLYFNSLSLIHLISYIFFASILPNIFLGKDEFLLMFRYLVLPMSHRDKSQMHLDKIFNRYLMNYC